MQAIVPRSLAVLGIIAAAGALNQGYAVDESGSSYYMRASVNGWLASTKGAFDYDSDSAQDSINFDNVDLDNVEITPMVEGGVSLPLLFDVYVGGFAYTQDGTATGSVDFGGKSFSGSLSSSYDLVNIYGELSKRLLNVELAAVSLGVAVHTFSSEMTVSDGGDSATLDESIYVPALAARGWVTPPGLGSLTVEARLHWMEMSISDTDVTFIDAAVSGMYRPYEHIGFLLGYRIMQQDLVYDGLGGAADNAEINFDLGGPFAGVMLQF